MRSEMNLSAKSFSIVILRSFPTEIAFNLYRSVTFRVFILSVESPELSFVSKFS